MFKPAVFLMIALLGPQIQNDPSCRLQISYDCLGLEYGLFGKQHHLRINDRNLIYYTSKTIYTVKSITVTDTLFTGKFSQASADSIIELVNQIPVNKIYLDNPLFGVWPLAVLNVNAFNKDIEFALRNTSDSRADRIVEIINQNLPLEYRFKIFVPRIDTAVLNKEIEILNIQKR